MLTIDVGVGGYFRVDIGHLEEHELAFGLRDGLAPYVQWECGGCSAEDSEKMVLPSLNGPLCDVTTVVVWR